MCGWGDCWVASCSPGSPFFFVFVCFLFILCFLFFFETRGWGDRWVAALRVTICSSQPSTLQWLSSSIFPCSFVPCLAVWGECWVSCSSPSDHLHFALFSHSRHRTDWNCWWVCFFALWDPWVFAEFLRFRNTSIFFCFMRSRVHPQLFKILKPPKALNDWWACCALFNFLPARSDLLIYNLFFFFFFLWHFSMSTFWLYKVAVSVWNLMFIKQRLRTMAHCVQFVLQPTSPLSDESINNNATNQTNSELTWF